MTLSGSNNPDNGGALSPTFSATLINTAAQSSFKAAAGQLDAKILEELRSYKQEQLLAALQRKDGLCKVQRLTLLQAIRKLNLKTLCQAFETSLKAFKDPSCSNETSSSHEICPIDEADVATLHLGPDGLDMTTEGTAHWNAGLQLIHDDKVCVVTLAGGQGSRLGSNLPKGLYDIGMPSHRSLFAIQAERLCALMHVVQSHFGTSKPIVVPWYIMTSESTHKDTVDHFVKHNYFGLHPTSINFFKQGTLPCFDLQGNILLEAPHKIATAPDGNGGIFRALVTEGVLQDMQVRGVEHVHIYSVDNVLVRIADPLFFGYCVAKGAQAGLKTVDKAEPSEAVGVLCRRAGHYALLEYSEMDADMAARTVTTKDGRQRLLFRHANIVNHYFSRSFLEKACAVLGPSEEDMPGLSGSPDGSAVEKATASPVPVGLAYHVAKKKIPYWDAVQGNRVQPTQPNGIKLELFIFDVFTLLDTPLAVLSVPRSLEFSPLKNATGTDSPSTCRRHLSHLNSSCLLKAGLLKMSPSPSPSHDPDLTCDVAPCLMYHGHGIPKTLVPKKPLQLPLNISSWSEI